MGRGPKKGPAHLDDSARVSQSNIFQSDVGDDSVRNWVPLGCSRTVTVAVSPGLRSMLPWRLVPPMGISKASWFTANCSCPGGNPGITARPAASVTAEKGLERRDAQASFRAASSVPSISIESMGLGTTMVAKRLNH